MMSNLTAANLVCGNELYRLSEQTPLDLRPRQGPSVDDWNRLRPIIRRLYIEEDRTLKDVMEIMARVHGHQASVKMYKTRFTQWGDFEKNNRAADMAILIGKKRKRDEQGKKSTFMVRSKEVSAEEVERYFERRNAQDATLEEVNADTPIHILTFSLPSSPGVEGAEKALMAQDELSNVPSGRIAGLIRKRKHKRSLNSLTGLVDEKGYHWVPPRERSLTSLISITAPYVFQKHELLFKNITDYVAGSIESGKWTANGIGQLLSAKRTSVATRDFAELCLQAAYDFQTLRSVRGRQLLSKACSLLPAMLLEERPEALENMLGVFFSLSKTGLVGLCVMLQDYLRLLANAILPTGSSWRQICITISLSDPDHLEVFLRSWRCLTNTLRHSVGRFARATVLNEINMITVLQKETDLRRGELHLRQLLADYEDMTTKLDQNAMFIVEGLAGNLLHQGRYKAAEDLLEEYINASRQIGCLSRYDEAFFATHLACLQYELCKYGMAEGNLRNAMTFLVQYFGLENPHAIRLSVILEKWLREWGREEEVDELQAEIEEMIGPDDIDVDANSFS